MPGFVHDPRHTYSYELRPSPHLDALLRTLAHELEANGLLLPGASTAPRFHPHLTLARAAVASPSAARAAADAFVAHAPGAQVHLVHAATFGDGRIVHVAPDDLTPMHAARAALVDALGTDVLDPLVLTRDWQPHITLAYAVPEPARAAALTHIASSLPLTGTMADVQVWHLDVRPTTLEYAAPMMEP